VVVALMGLAGSALALDGSSSCNAPSKTACEADAKVSIPASVAAFVGEWEGTVEIRWNEKESSASVCSVSSVACEDGSLLSCFEGYARGEHFEGSMRLRVNEETQRAFSVSYDSRTGATTRVDGATGDVQNVLTLSGEADHPLLMKKIKVRQVARLVSKNECVIEWLTLDKEGKEAPRMKLTLTRMESGKTAAAHDLIDNPRLLAKVDSKELTRTADAGE
jgi:hypothetical protein